MFKIILDNKIIDICETPRYVKKKDNIWIKCSKSDAEGIAVRNEVYSTAVAVPIDEGESMYQLQQDIQEIQNIRISDIENALCELTLEARS